MKVLAKDLEAGQVILVEYGDVGNFVPFTVLEVLTVGEMIYVKTSSRVGDEELKFTFDTEVKIVEDMEAENPEVVGSLEISVKQTGGVIEFNSAEIKAGLTDMMELYKTTVVTKDTIISNKKDVATLNKMKKGLSDKRIEVVKEYMKPCDAFELEVKEITKLIDEPVKIINDQLEVFEIKRIADKKAEIENAYEELIGEVKEYLPLAKIYDSKWENKGITIKSIRTSIEGVVASTEMAITTINNMNSEATVKALEIYKQNLSLTDAITHINNYERQKAEIEAKAEEKRKQEEETKRLAEIERIKTDERKRLAEEETKRLAEIERIKADERKQVAEEERIRAEERQKVIDEAKAKEKIKEIEEKIMDIVMQPITGISEPFVSESTEDTEMPFAVDEEEKPFDLPKWTTLKVLATSEEMCDLLLHLNNAGIDVELEG